jgi:outer membrane protein assembly factor BamB
MSHLVRRVALPLILAAGCSSSPGGSAASGPTVPFAPGSPWPKFRGNAAQTARGAVHASQQGGAQWKFPTGRGIFSSPVVGADGTIYFGSADRSFYALDASGSLRWSIATGEIIDSSGLLDDQGRVYFGSGDGTLRAADAQTGALVWSMKADDPKTIGSFINWFEGNVALGPDGTLFVPNDNFLLYAVDRATGAPKWTYKMPDQTWSLPAVDATTGGIYVGNNNLLPILGKNTFSIAADGTTNWSMVSLGTVAASPMLAAGGEAVVVGGFDGYTRAYTTADGTVSWELATRDHIYASPAELPDGTIVQPSCDGTVYAVSPADGTVRWTFDAATPIRSSPAVDADGHVYVGGGDGRLYVLDPDGTLRYAMKLIDDPRNDLNASPALGNDAVYIGGESGEMFSVPYDWCLRPENASDARCTTQLPARPDGATLAWVNSFGDVVDGPATVPGNAPITLLLSVRAQGAQQLAVLDSSSLQVTLTPASDAAVDVSGDGKFVTIAPKVAFAPGPLSIAIQGSYLTGMQRAGLRLSGGQVGGSVGATLSTAVAPSGAGAIDPASVYELSRLSVPLPTEMPSYNQIGFDSLHYLLATVQAPGSAPGLAYMVGAAIPAAGGAAVVDPSTKAIFPMALSTSGDLATFEAASGLEVQIMSFTLPFQTFRLSLGFAPGGEAAGTAQLAGSAVCGGIPFYGPFLQQLGLCNPQTDVIRVLGAANAARRTDVAAPAAGSAGTVTFASGGDAVTATLAGASARLAEHLAAVLVLDGAGKPVTLDYGTGTTRTANPDGTIATVGVPTKGVTLPAQMQAMLMLDMGVVAHGTLP